MEPEVVGAIKIKDGLFIGDEFAAQVTFWVPQCKIAKNWARI